MAVQLVESYRRLGLSEKEAVIAATVEAAVEDIAKSRRELRKAAKMLGISDTEADAFANPQPPRNKNMRQEGGGQ